MWFTTESLFQSSIKTKFGLVTKISLNRWAEVVEKIDICNLHEFDENTCLLELSVQSSWFLELQLIPSMFHKDSPIHYLGSGNCAIKLNYISKLSQSQQRSWLKQMRLINFILRRMLCLMKYQEAFLAWHVACSDKDKRWERGWMRGRQKNETWKERGEKGEEIKSENAWARDNEGKRVRKLEVGRGRM